MENRASNRMLFRSGSVSLIVGVLLFPAEVLRAEPEAPAAPDSPPRVERGTGAAEAVPRGADLHRRYTSAVHYFRPGLNEQQSGAIAAAVISGADEAGLDARFLLAVLAEEGVLARVRSSGG